MKTTLSNIENQTVELEKHLMKWLFEIEEGVPPSNEHKDQIFPLTKDAAKYLWDYEAKIRIGKFYPKIDKYFKNTKEFKHEKREKREKCEEKKLKKWLFHLKIPFDTKVFLSLQPDSGFVLTWKMVIKYCSRLFWAHDVVLFDKTLNWGLYYHHDELFHFGEKRIYNAEFESKKILKDAELIADWKNKADKV